MSSTPQRQPPPPLAVKWLCYRESLRHLCSKPFLWFIFASFSSISCFLSQSANDNTMVLWGVVEVGGASLTPEDESGVSGVTVSSKIRCSCLESIPLGMITERSLHRYIITAAGCRRNGGMLRCTSSKCFLSSSSTSFWAFSHSCFSLSCSCWYFSYRDRRIEVNLRSGNILTGLIDLS